MRPVTIGLANINTTVGALKSNTDKIIERASLMAAERCTVGCFSEQAISGYPVEDLVGWKGFVDAQWQELLRFADATQNFDHPVVFIVGLTVRDHEDNYNCAAVVYKGVILGVVPKEKLPGYDVFYENRMFTNGGSGMRGEIHGVPFGDLIFRFPFGCLSVDICEDGWFSDGPQRRRAFSGAELAVNLSASPYRSGIVELRRFNISARSRDNRTAYCYVNQIGAQDSLVFDGGGFVYQSGDPVFEAARWQEQISYCTIDLDETEQARHRDAVWLMERESWLKENTPVLIIDAPHSDASFANPHPLTPPSFPPPQRSQAELFNELLIAMKLGLKDYFEKTCAFKTIGVAMSGGKDSALTLIVAWLYARERFAALNEKDRALAIRNFIHCFSMPTRYNSSETRSVAQDLCSDLGVSFTEISIEDAFAREVSAARDMLHGHEPTPLTLQNIQARIRGMRMWNWSNSLHGLWLQSGNMSEKAVGYTTIGGDLMGGYSLIGNLPKTTVIALLHHLYSIYKFDSLKNLLQLEASAELQENQADERDLMPFPVLDACYDLFAGEKLMPVELYHQLRAKWSDDELRAMDPSYKPGTLKSWTLRFLKLFLASIYKWVQAPQAVHLSNLELDRERALQLPVVQSPEWLDLKSLEDLEE